MENTIYRVDLHDGFKLECYVYGTNEVNPYIETRELGFIVYGNKPGDIQFDAVLDESELDSLIRYLEDCSRYINNFSKKSKVENGTI